MKVAVIIPCLNEEASIAKVVLESKKYLPHAQIFVLDNGSNDSTSAVAAQAGATVIHSPLRGKGHVLRHAFREIEADWYIMVDGDGTYPMSEAPKLLKTAQEQNFEMVLGSRLVQAQPQAFRRFHYFGNQLFTELVKLLFRFPVRDLLTGFRVFSKRFASEMNLLSTGFEIETELTIRAIAQGMPFCEIDIPYSERPIGSSSKLKTFRDGFRILATILRLMMYFRPLAFFATAAVLTWACSPWLPRHTQIHFQNIPALMLVLGFYFDIRQNTKKMQRRQSTLQKENPSFKKVA